MTLDLLIIFMTVIAVLLSFIFYKRCSIRSYHKQNIQRIKEREADKARVK